MAFKKSFSIAIMNPQIAFLLSKSLDSLGACILETAELYLKQAIKIEPSNSHALRLLGVLSFKRGSFSDALVFLNKSLEALPTDALTLSNLGILYFETGDNKKALDAFNRSIKIDPAYDEVWSNKGNVLYELKLYEEAIAHHDQAIKINPRYAEAWSNKGNILFELGLYEQAIAHHDQAIKINPRYAKAWSNKGNVLSRLGFHKDALAHFDMALSIDPHYYDAIWNKSLSLLLQGDFENGLPLYESRWHARNISKMAGKRTFSNPVWLGHESLKGKTILLYGEQGLGDYIQFCRYSKLVADLGGNVILEAPKTLAPLMESLEGITQIVEQGVVLPMFDYQCPLLSLPLAFKTDASSIPAEVPYLRPSSQQITKWTKKLGEKNRKRVGLAWSSVSGFRGDSDRSLLLEQFVEALPSEGIEFICLQKELKECDREFFNKYQKIKFVGEELHDFSETAALIENLDLVISTCTSIPHLSGALGKETWLLLSHSPDWRWLLDREDSPWYPNTKLYRQPTRGDWSTAFKKVKLHLSESINI